MCKGVVSAGRSHKKLLMVLTSWKWGWERRGSAFPFTPVGNFYHELITFIIIVNKIIPKSSQDKSPKSVAFWTKKHFWHVISVFQNKLYFIGKNPEIEKKSGLP